MPFVRPDAPWYHEERCSVAALLVPLVVLTGLVSSVLLGPMLSGSQGPTSGSFGGPQEGAVVRSGAARPDLTPSVEATQASFRATSGAEVLAPWGVWNWSQFQGSAAHAGLSNWTGPANNTAAWNYTLGGSEDGITADNGTLVVTEPDSQYGYLYALSPLNGSFGFTYYTAHTMLGDATSVAPFYATIGEGQLYMENYCIGCFLAEGPWAVSDNLSRGSEVWEDGIPSSPAHSPLYGWGYGTYLAGKFVYVQSGTGTVFAFSSSNGSVLWTASVATASLDTIPTAGSGQVLVGSASTDNATALSLENGSILWNFTADAPIVGSPSYAGGEYYFGTSRGTVYAISDSGTSLWSADVGAPVQATPAVTSSGLYVGTQNGTLYDLSPTSGSVLWTYTIANGSMDTSPAVSSNGMVYQSTSNGTVLALNASTGTLVWKAYLGDPTLTSPALYDGCLYTTNTAGRVMAFGECHSATLASVAISAHPLPLLTNSSVTLQAEPSCSGGPCPSGTSYAWAVNNTLASLNATTGGGVVLRAGGQAGTVSVFVQASLDGTEQSGSLSLSILPALERVQVYPPNPGVPTGGALVLHTSLDCLGGVCPVGAIYSWKVNNSLGTLVPSGPNATLTAGNLVGTLTVQVSVLLDGVTQNGSEPVEIFPGLASVQVTPANATLFEGAAINFNTTLLCTDGPCPSGAAYAWSLNNSLATLRSDSGPNTTLVAGSVRGSVLLTVKVTLNGQTIVSTVRASVVPPPSPAASSLLWPWGPVIVVVVVIGVLVAYLVLRRRRRPAPGSDPGPAGPPSSPPG